jgi:hypothetical protein
MQMSGHKTRSIFERYNIVSVRELVEAAAKMELHMAAMGTISDSAGKQDSRVSY